MRIAVIGTGYVGLVSGVCFAELGHQVACIDIDRDKIKRLRTGESPIYEPGISVLLKKNIRPRMIGLGPIRHGRLRFFDNVKEGILGAEVIFIAVGTPSRDDGTVETKHVEQVAADIGAAIKKYVVVVNKSTVPAGTGKKVRQIISKQYGGRFDVVSNPEFLREGQAVSDFMYPDRVVLGVESDGARRIMKRLYSKIKTEMFFTNIVTAEMIKYASNSFLATSISFINSLSELCERVGADINEVAYGMKLDKRIGRQAFLTAGPGFGGSCFPKDVRGMISIAREHGVRLPILDVVMEVNKKQGDRVFQKVEKILGGNVRGKMIAVWGLAFKPETDDLRESPAVNLVARLVKSGAKIKCYDPAAENNGRKMLPNILFAKSPLGALKGADCLVIMTEWGQFKKIKLAQIKKVITGKNIIDARNIYKKTEAVKLGLNYEGVGQ